LIISRTNSKLERGSVRDSKRKKKLKSFKRRWQQQRRQHKLRKRRLPRKTLQWMQSWNIVGFDAANQQVAIRADGFNSFKDLMEIR
jgi:hypothetical protein